MPQVMKLNSDKMYMVLQGLNSAIHLAKFQALILRRFPDVSEDQLDLVETAHGPMWKYERKHAEVCE